MKVNNVFNCAFSAFRIALIQLAVSSNKAQNLVRAKDKIKEAVSKGAKIVALPVSMLKGMRVSISLKLSPSLPWAQLPPAPTHLHVFRSNLEVCTAHADVK